MDVVCSIKIVSGIETWWVAQQYLELAQCGRSIHMSKIHKESIIKTPDQWEGRINKWSISHFGRFREFGPHGLKSVTYKSILVAS